MTEGAPRAAIGPKGGPGPVPVVPFLVSKGADYHQDDDEQHPAVILDQPHQKIADRHHSLKLEPGVGIEPGGLLQTHQPPGSTQQAANSRLGPVRPRPVGRSRERQPMGPNGGSGPTCHTGESRGYYISGPADRARHRRVPPRLTPSKRGASRAAEKDRRAGQVPLSSRRKSRAAVFSI